MEIKSNEEWTNCIEKAVAGDKEALERIVLNLQDMVFNLSLRMLGTFPDAEDAAQDILLKVITRLATFRGESAFTTWVFRIATNHLIQYKKHMFAQRPLSFEYYGADIENARLEEVPDLTQNVERFILAEELKMSCTNVLLQCLDAESRCIFVLGTMFKLDSRIAGEILDMTPEAIGFALERLLEAGALDAWTTPIGMKKSRPGVLLRALCRPEKRQAVLDVFLRDTTTLGVREHRCSRTALQRSVSETDSPWGPVRCKQAGGYGVSRKKYEFDDLARIARETGLSLPELLEKLP